MQDDFAVACKCGCEGIEHADAVLHACMKDRIIAQTPPAYAKDCEGREFPWAEYLTQKMREFQEELEENTFLLCRLYQCREVLREHPENVEEG